jgi:hypothetical protein
VDIPQDIREIEQIKQLKARYIRFGDTQNWRELATLLTEDFEAVFDVAPRFSKDQPARVALSGRNAFIGAWAPALVGVTTVHQAFLPEIVLTGPTAATGVWGLHDIVLMPKCRFKGWGHYHDVYVKEDGHWKIRSTRATRLHIEETWL